MVFAKHRQTTFIDRAVQGTLVKRVVLHWLFFIATSMAAVTLLQVVLGDPSKTLLEHVQAASRQYALFFIVMFTLLPAFVLDSIRLSHRFTGPVFRIQQTFKAVADGQPFRPVRFRENDYWRDVADDFNRMMEHLGLPDHSPFENEDEVPSESDPCEETSQTDEPTLVQF